MVDEIQKLETEILSALAEASHLSSLEEVRVQFLGQNGSLTVLLTQLSSLPKEQRPLVGKVANEAKTKTKLAYEARKEALTATQEAAAVDDTLPGRPVAVGSLHPIYEIRDRAITILRRLGFALADGPDIETEFYNFDALNTPADHPARNEQDTFYLHLENQERKPGRGATRLLLRTQTSPVQIRTMEKSKPPIRIIAPGRCYRRDEIDATHGLSFHQMEGVVVAEGVSLVDLKGTLELFFRELLGQELQFRFRPHFFPFTEPSFEVDCRRPGTQVKGRDWLEICGCGMVNPKVLQAVQIDPERYTGFAFGFGIERIAMMVYGVPDLRLFSQNDVRFLRQLSSV
jgi:phenylalanyl-tRNA synthetase alpha chain